MDIDSSYALLGELRESLEACDASGPHAPGEWQVSLDRPDLVVLIALLRKDLDIPDVVEGGPPSDEERQADAWSMLGGNHAPA